MVCHNGSCEIRVSSLSRKRKALSVLQVEEDDDDEEQAEENFDDDDDDVAML